MGKHSNRSVALPGPTLNAGRVAVLVALAAVVALGLAAAAFTAGTLFAADQPPTQPMTADARITASTRCTGLITNCGVDVRQDTQIGDRPAVQPQADDDDDMGLAAAAVGSVLAMALTAVYFLAQAQQPYIETL